MQFILAFKILLIVIWSATWKLVWFDWMSCFVLFYHYAAMHTTFFIGKKKFIAIFIYHIQSRFSYIISMLYSLANCFHNGFSLWARHMWIWLKDVGLWTQDSPSERLHVCPYVYVTLKCRETSSLILFSCFHWTIALRQCFPCKYTRF